MNLYCIKGSNSKKNINVKIKQKIDGKFVLNFCSIDFGCKKYETINKNKLSNLLKI